MRELIKIFSQPKSDRVAGRPILLADHQPDVFAFEQIDWAEGRHLGRHENGVAIGGPKGCKLTENLVKFGRNFRKFQLGSNRQLGL